MMQHEQQPIKVTLNSFACHLQPPDQEARLKDSLFMQSFRKRGKNVAATRVTTPGMFSSLEGRSRAITSSSRLRTPIPSCLVKSSNVGEQAFEAKLVNANILSQEHSLKRVQARIAKSFS